MALPSRNIADRFQHWAALIFAIALLSFSALAEFYNSSREVGIIYDDGELGIIVRKVNGPAARAGLIEGDTITSIQGESISNSTDYEHAAHLFRSGYPVNFKISRSARELDVNVRPGVSFSWGDFLLHGIGVLAFLAIGSAIQMRRSGYLRANLLSLYCLTVILELGMPAAPRGYPIAGLLLDCLFYINSGIQFGLGLHLISVFPERRTWLIKHPKIIPTYYVVGVGFGTAAAVAVAFQAFGGQTEWWIFKAVSVFSNFFLPMWACTSAALLLSTARRYPHPDGRREATLLLWGVVPWAGFTLAFSILDSRYGIQPPTWAEILVLLAYPLLIGILLWTEFKLAGQSLLGLASELRNVGSADKVVALTLAKIESIFHPSETYAWVQNQEGVQGEFFSRPEGLRSDGLKPLPESYLFGLIEKNGDIVDVDLLAQILPGEVEALLKPAHITLVVAITSSRRRLAGLIMLSNKKSEEGYDLGDRKILRAISAQAGAHLELISLQTAESGSESLPRRQLRRRRLNMAQNESPKITNQDLVTTRTEGLFDVFMCHNSLDKPEVKKIAQQLKNIGLLPWLDEWELQPGQHWISALEQQIDKIGAVAVFFGSTGIGPWQQEEVLGFLTEFVSRKNPLIPVLLPDASDKPVIPVFLKTRTWVDFRKQDPDPLKQLIWGITGEHPDNRIF